LADGQTDIAILLKEVGEDMINEFVHVTTDLELADVVGYVL
jgi:hypothetical protein